MRARRVWAGWLSAGEADSRPDLPLCDHPQSAPPWACGLRLTALTPDLALVGFWRGPSETAQSGRASQPGGGKKKEETFEMAF